MKRVEEIPFVMNVPSLEAYGRMTNVTVETAEGIAKRLHIPPGWEHMTRLQMITHGVRAGVPPEDMWIVTSKLDWNRRGIVTEQDFTDLQKRKFDPEALRELLIPSIYNIRDIVIPLRTKLMKQAMFGVIDQVWAKYDLD